MVTALLHFLLEAIAILRFAVAWDELKLMEYVYASRKKRGYDCSDLPFEHPCIIAQCHLGLYASQRLANLQERKRLSEFPVAYIQCFFSA